VRDVEIRKNALPQLVKIANKPFEETKMLHNKKRANEYQAYRKLLQKDDASKETPKKTLWALNLSARAYWPNF